MFPFGQIDKTKDCGYRCTYYILRKFNAINQKYEEWLNNFRFFTPEKNGITFNDICQILNFYKINYKFTELNDVDTYIIYSGNWLKPEKNHGHYFVYDKQIVYCSLKDKPYIHFLKDTISKIEGKTTEEAYRCLKIYFS